MAPTLRLQFLGGFQLVSGNAVHTTVSTARLQALLAYLVLHRDAPQPRYHLAFQFWPDSPEPQARTNLRKLFHQLHQALPDADRFLRADAQAVQWRPDAPFSLDVIEFERAVAQANSRQALQDAVALYRGDLLPSCYDDWIVPERERLRQSFVEALDRLVGVLEDERDSRAAIGYAQRLLQCDPLREETYRRLMRLHALNGDRAGVLRVYETCAAVLQRELGVKPSPATREAYDHLLRMDAPAMSPLGPAMHNLPAPTTSFIGREREIATIKELLKRDRLVTLTGAGGCGKTRLALRVADDLVEEYPDGVWWVELAALSDPALVCPTVAATVGVHEQPNKPLEATLADALRGKRLLLLFDNCEHLAVVCASLIERLLRACPELHFLVTSRETLGMVGETTWMVPSLSVPPHLSPADDSASHAMQYEAVRLLVERAAAVQPTFTLTNRNAAAVVQICRRLDGIPLALELAAARAKVLSPEQIAARLDDRFSLLTGGSRTALPRHQTLRATIDWSYSFLSAQERTLLRRLAVFSGGFTLEAVEGVCADAPLSPHNVLNELSHLADKSMVEVEPQGAIARYRLLETLREYARARLIESGEATTIQQYHLNFFLRLSEDAKPILTSTGRGFWLSRLEQEHDNLRAALQWVIGQQDKQVKAGLRLLENLLWLWSFGGHWREARGWLEQILALPGASAHKRARANVLYVAGWLAFLQGCCEWAIALSEEGLALYRELGDKSGIARMLSNIGSAAELLGDYERAQRLLNEGLSLRSEIGDDPRIAGTLLLNLGRVHMMRGEHEQAGKLFKESLALYREAGDEWNIALCVLHLGWLSLFQGDIDKASATFADSLAQFQKTGERYGTTTFNFLGFAAVAVFRGKIVQAVRLAGAMEALHEATGFQLPASYRRIYDDLREAARTQLGETAFATEWNKGRAMSQEQAIAYALEETKARQV